MTENIFERVADQIIADQIKESDKRWEKIEELVGALTYISDNNVPTNSEGTTLIMCKLLLLFAEQFKPMGTIGDSASKLQKEIIDMVDAIGNNFGGRKNNG